MLLRGRTICSNKPIKVGTSIAMATYILELGIFMVKYPPPEMQIMLTSPIGSWINVVCRPSKPNERIVRPLKAPKEPLL